MPINPNISPDGVAIASASVLTALIDALFAKNILDKAEVVALLNAAASDVSARPHSQGCADATRLIRETLARFS